MKIITLTLNPAFDIHCYTPNFAPYHENLARITDRDASGKGVNISRALTVRGIENLAVVVLGDENGEDFSRLLDADALNYRAITVSGRIRENITLHTDGANETRISFEGFLADDRLLDEVLSVIEEYPLDGAIVTFTGRAATGLSMGRIKEFLRALRSMGARIVIDSKSFTLDDIIEVKPYLIKPNQEEISEYLGRAITDFSEVRAAAEELYRVGIENVMISLGAEGALLVCADGSYVAVPPKIDALSTIGAGDSTVAGFISVADSARDGGDRLRMAVAYGTAACLTSGTRPPRREDVDTVYEGVSVRKI